MKKLIDVLPHVITEVKHDNRLERFKDPLFLRKISLEIIKDLLY